MIYEALKPTRKHPKITCERCSYETNISFNRMRRVMGTLAGSTRFTGKEVKEVISRRMHEI